METGEKVNKGLKALEEKVFGCNLCAVCGACLSLCPYLRSWKGRVVKLDDCNLEEGRCFAYCPRTDIDLDEVYQGIFGKNYEEIEIGTVRKILMARAKDPLFKKKAQTGGVVSALVDFALREKMIQAGILTPRDGDLLPQGRIIKGRKEIIRCAGSSYVSGPTLEAFNRGPWKGEERIGTELAWGFSPGCGGNQNSVTDIASCSHYGISFIAHESIMRYKLIHNRILTATRLIPAVPLL